MKRPLVLLLALGTACSGSRPQQKEAAPAPAPAAAPEAPPVAPAPPPEPVVVLRPDPEAPVVSVRLVFRAGTAEDPRGQEGLTSLLGSLMTEATETLDATALSQALFPFATSVHHHVDADVTVFSMTVHREVAARALPYLFDVVAAPRLDPKDLERLRQDAITAIQKDLRQSDDEGLGHAALAHFLWPNHPYGRLDTGTVESLKALTLEQLQAQRHKLFTRARLVAGLGGGFDNAIEQAFRAGMARLPAGDATGPAPLPEPVQPKGLQVHLIQKDTASTPINLGFPYGLKRSDPDFPLLLVANSAFGEHRQLNGRLFLRMRELRGLNYGDYSYVEHFAQEGWETIPQVNIPRRQQAFTLWVRPVEAEDAPFALRQVLFELRGLVADGISADEFERSRSFLQGYTRVWEQGTSRKLGYALDDVLNGTPEFLPHLRERLATMTREEVNAAVKRHLQADNLVVVLLSKDAAALRETLLSGAPTPRRPEKTRVLPAAEQEVDARMAAYPLGLTPEQVSVVPVTDLFER